MDALQCPTEVLFNSRFSISVKFGCQALQFRDEVIVVLELDDSVKVEMSIQVRTSPIDRDCLRYEAIYNLLRVISRLAGVLRTDTEHVWLKYCPLVFNAGRAAVLPHRETADLRGKTIVNFLPQNVPRQVPLEDVRNDTANFFAETSHPL